MFVRCPNELLHQPRTKHRHRPNGHGTSAIYRVREHLFWSKDSTTSTDWFRHACFSRALEPARDERKERCSGESAAAKLGERGRCTAHTPRTPRSPANIRRSCAPRDGV